MTETAELDGDCAWSEAFLFSYCRVGNARDIAIDVGGLPSRFDEILCRNGDIGRGLDQRELGDIARAVGKDRPGLHPHDQLGADGFGNEGVVTL